MPPLPFTPSLNATPREVALPIIGPGVIDAAEILFALALRVEADQCAAMGAAIFEGIDLAVHHPASRSPGCRRFSWCESRRVRVAPPQAPDSASSVRERSAAAPPGRRRRSETPNKAPASGPRRAAPARFMQHPASKSTVRRMRVSVPLLTSFDRAGTKMFEYRTSYSITNKLNASKNTVKANGCEQCVSRRAAMMDQRARLARDRQRGNGRPRQGAGDHRGVRDPRRAQRAPMPRAARRSPAPPRDAA